MGRKARLLGASQVLTLGLITSLACAEPAPPPRNEQRARLLSSADQAMRDGRLADARDIFLALWDATQEIDAACNVGRLSVRIGDNVRAAEYLELCLADARGAGADEADIRIELAEARRKVGQLRVRAPAGAEVTIDGEPRGQGTITAYVAPGPHTVRVLGADGVSAETTAHALAGESRVVALHFKPEFKPEAPPGPDGRIIAAGGVLSAALAGTAIGLMVLADQHDEASRQGMARPNGCAIPGDRRCEEAARSHETAAALRTWSTVAFAAAAAGTAGTLTYALFPRVSSGGGRLAGAGVVVGAVW